MLLSLAKKVITQITSSISILHFVAILFAVSTVSSILLMRTLSIEYAEALETYRMRNQLYVLVDELDNSFSVLKSSAFQTIGSPRETLDRRRVTVLFGRVTDAANGVRLGLKRQKSLSGASTARMHSLLRESEQAAGNAYTEFLGAFAAVHRQSEKELRKHTAAMGRSDRLVGLKIRQLRGAIQDSQGEWWVWHLARIDAIWLYQLLAGVSILLVVVLITAVGHRLQRNLAVARYQADAGNLAKSDFLANMSHEIRTPLNGVVGLAAALARTELNASQLEIVSIIQSSGQTLTQLLSDILDFSKLEAGKLEVKNEIFDLQKTMDSAAGLMRSLANDKGVGLQVEFGPAARGQFVGDAVRIRQIVSNLVSNAVKFTHHGEVRVTIDVRVSADRDESVTLLIGVEDTGIGFDSETAKRLFQRFVQADGTITRNYGGTGLGLSICKALAQAMGGDITAESQLGKGSKFMVTLGLTRATPLIGLNHTDAPLDVLAIEGPALRILLAEDNSLNQQVVGFILEPCGVEIEIANDGQEAVDKFSIGTFDLILMDMQMPIMDGLSAVRAIRALERESNRPRTPIAMLTANAMAHHIDEASRAGADLHISKPITPESLLRGIQSVLEHNGGADANVFVKTRVA